MFFCESASFVTISQSSALFVAPSSPLVREALVDDTSRGGGSLAAGCGGGGVVAEGGGGGDGGGIAGGGGGARAFLGFDGRSAASISRRAAFALAASAQPRAHHHAHAATMATKVARSAANFRNQLLSELI